MRTSVLVFATLLVSCAAAQRTFVVDAANGPGTHFTDLPPALLQAQHRDVFLIRAGTYSPARTDKGVALLGTARVRIDGGSGTTAPLDVANLPAGETFAAKQIELASLAVPSLMLLRCQGRIHLSALLAGSTPAAEAITISQCRVVTVTEARLFGGLRADGTTLVITSSVLNGRTAGFSPAHSTPALLLQQSTSLIADSVLRGP